MYYPFFRGKQYELITVRETAPLLAEAKFVPVIEPVKQSLNALKKTIEALQDVEAKAILIVNPFHGDHAEDNQDIVDYVKEVCEESDDIAVGILLREETSLDDAIEHCERHKDHQIALIHSGFSHGKYLAEYLKEGLKNIINLFMEGKNGKLYQRRFKGDKRVLLRDGFEARRNKDHPPIEFFSDLHVTYEEEGMTGFGDFLIVGDDYKDSGGPAYAVAIHITFIDDQDDDVMNIYHFVSDRTDTPTDPAGKFGEALDKLIEELSSENCKIFQSSAINEFRDLHARGHYPGLGYVKKLAMKHHIETLVDYFEI